MARNTEKEAKRNTNCTTQNIARNSENVKYDKYTLQDLDLGEKRKKHAK